MPHPLPETPRLRLRELHDGDASFLLDDGSGQCVIDPDGAEMLVRRCDLLIAIWDGLPPRGRGGTADVITEARRSGVPVVWIDPKAPDELHSLIPGPASASVPASDLVIRWRAARASSRAMPRPMPEFDPVMMAVFPFSDISVSL